MKVPNKEYHFIERYENSRIDSFLIKNKIKYRKCLRVYYSWMSKVLFNRCFNKSDLMFMNLRYYKNTLIIK